MDAEEKIKKLQAMTGANLDHDIFYIYLKLAQDKIFHRLFQYGIPEVVSENPDTYIEPYEIIQLDIAAYLVNKRGAEGETEHSENGVSRKYGSADVPSSLLEPIHPYAKIGDSYAGFSEK